MATYRNEDGTTWSVDLASCERDVERARAAVAEADAQLDAALEAREFDVAKAWADLRDIRREALDLAQTIEADVAAGKPVHQWFDD